MTILKKEKGFTLIELLMVVLLGSIVLMGVAQVFSLNQNTSLLQRSLIETQNTGFFVSNMITNDLQKTGLSDESISKYDVIPFNFSQTADQSGGNSKISITYMNNGNDFDCDGTSGLSTITNTYEVKNGILQCNDLPLINNVERFKVKYGIDLNGDNFVDRYVNRDTALEITNTNKYKVVSIQFAILLSSDKEYELISSKSFNILNSETLTFNDGKYYRLFTKNVILKNML